MLRTHERHLVLVGICPALPRGIGVDSRHDAAGSRARRSTRVVVIGRPIDTDGRADVRDIDNLHSRSDEWPQSDSKHAERP